MIKTDKKAGTERIGKMPNCSYPIFGVMPTRQSATGGIFSEKMVKFKLDAEKRLVSPVLPAGRSNNAQISSPV